jgi:hypothetical protein
MPLVAAVDTNCHGKQVTNNTFFGEFRPSTQAIVDSLMIVRIMPAQELADKNRGRSKLQILAASDKERHG